MFNLQKQPPTKFRDYGSSLWPYEHLLTITGTDGDEYIVKEGGTYTYSSDLTTWIRKEAYDLIDGDVALLAKIDGDSLPDAETPVWVDTESGTGVISTDGTSVTWDASLATTDTAYSTFTHSATGEALLAQGYFSVVSVGSADDDEAHTISIADGTRKPIVNLHHIANLSARVVDDSNVVIGTVNKSVLMLAHERFVEIISDPTGNHLVFFDNADAAALSVPYATALGDAALTMVIGDLIATANMDSEITGRNIKFFRLT